MARSCLEAAGIETQLQDEFIAQTYNLGSNAFGGVKLWVKNADLIEGKRLLVEGGYLQPEEERDADEWVWVKGTADRTRCPFCRSEDIGPVGSSNFAALVLRFLFGAFSPLFRPTYHCGHCGRFWKYRGKDGYREKPDKTKG